MKPPQFDPSWSPEVVEIWKNDCREMWDPTIERPVYHQYHNQLDLYLQLVDRYQATSVLDVGCAQGTLALLLAERGVRVTALDIRQPFLDYAVTRYERGDVQFVAANIFDNLDLGSFDLVFGNQIIEHLVYPVAFLETLASYVRPGGILVVSTPNHGYFRSRLPSYTDLGDPKQHEYRQFSAGGGDHFFAYTEEELRTAAATAELDVLEMIYFETPAMSGHFLVRYLHWLPVQLLRAADRFALRFFKRSLAHQLCMVLKK